MNIIGINGFKRSGKGEVGKAINELLLGVHQLGFADNLKILAARTLGYLPADYNDQECIALMDEAKEKWAIEMRRRGNHTRVKRQVLRNVEGVRPRERTNLTMREFLQNMGTEARTVFGDDFWVDQVLPAGDLSYETGQYALAGMYPHASTLAFTDLRFINEAERIHSLDGINIEVIRPGIESDGHASEKPLPRSLIDYQVFNVGTLQDLRWEVNKVLELAGLM